MPNTLTTAQIQQQLNLLSQGGTSAISSFYSYMSGQGYGYANLANGLVTCSALAGQVALNYLEDTASSNGVTLSTQQVQNIEFQMAQAYGQQLLTNSQATGQISADITFQQAATFHAATFAANGMPADSWTLNAPAQVLGATAMQGFWANIISPNSATANLGSAELYAAMANEAGNVGMEDVMPPTNFQAADWLARVGSAGMTTVFAPNNAACAVGSVSIDDAAGNQLTVSVGSPTSSTDASYAVSQMGANIFATGTGAVLSDNNSKINVDAQSSIGLTGSSNTNVNLYKGSTVSLLGDIDNPDGSISGGVPANSGISVTGTDGTGNVINVAGGNTGLSFNTTNTTVNFTNNGEVGSATLSGSGNVANLQGAMNLTLDATGSWVNFYNAGSLAEGGDLQLADGLAVTVGGTGSGIINNFSSGSTGLDNAIVTSSGVHLTDDGGTQAFNLGTGSFVQLNGVDDAVGNAQTGDVVQVGNNTSAAILGNGGENVQLFGTGSSVYANSAIITYGDGGSATDYLFGSGDQFKTGGLLSGALTVQGIDDTGSISGVSLSYQGATTGDTLTDPSEPINYYTSETSFTDPTSSSDPDCADGDPVILNLSGGAISTVSLASSTAYFNSLNSGKTVHTGWGTAGEGYLVFDPSNTNTVTGENSLVTGFAELKKLDSNGDGVLNSLDAGWNALKVWVDTTGNGSFQSSNLHTLASLGISSINLNSSYVDQNNNGNTILDESTFTWASGGTGNIAGVSLVVDSSPAPAPIGGGGGGTCVECSSLLPGGRTAGEMVVGSVMDLADEQTLESATGVVSRSDRRIAPGVRITTESGITLVCSDTAPIPTPGGLVKSPLLLGLDVAVRRDEGGSFMTGWERVVRLESVGPIEVQQITVGDRCYWAGEKENAFILHHNLTHQKP